jgi:ATP-dependent helicase/nuclease subunit A
MNLTDAQRRAVETTDRNLVLRAGAGTGKTLVLTEHFLFLLEQRLAPATEIAAVTYTEKAANELKVRLRTGTLARERTATSPEDRRYWRDCRLQVERAPIGTFHSFCARLLREQALRSGLDPTFRVLDDAEALVLRARAITETLRHSVEEEEEHLAEVLRAFSFARLEDLLDRMAERPEVCDGAARGFLAQETRQLCLTWEKWRRGAEKKVVQTVVSDRRWHTCLSRLKQLQATDPKDKADQNRRHILALASTFPAQKEPADVLEDIRKACTKGVGSKKNWNLSELEALRQTFTELKESVTAEAQKELSRLQPTGGEERMAQGLRALSRLYLDLRARYGRLKDDEGALDFDDLLIRARDLLRESREVRAYCQRHIRFLLVDEFQDNADLERDILFFIAERRPAATRREGVELEPGKLFIVGDDKQSIYRFRGADVTVFNETARLFWQARSEDALAENFRSTPALVAFANALFSAVMGEEEREELFQSRHVPLEAERPAGRYADPGVEILAVAKAAGETLDVAREREAEALATRLGELTTSVPVVADPKTGELRPASPSEVAVLFRSLSPVELYERALREAGLPYYLVGGRDYYERPEVRDVVMALRAMLSPDDELALAGWLRSPMCGLTDEGLWLLAREGGLRHGLAHGERFLGGHPDEARARRACEVLAELRPEVGRLSVREALERLLLSTGFLATVHASAGGRQLRANLEQLLELARTVEASGEVSLRDFLRLVEDLTLRGPREEPAATIEEAGEAIRLMTIHQAKGLEFPVVCVADLGRGKESERQALLTHRQLGFAAKLKVRGGEEAEADDKNGDSLPWRLIRWQEAREAEAERERLLYVAVTRARDYLVLSGPWAMDGNARSEGTWMGWLRKSVPGDVQLPAAGTEVILPFRGATVRFRHGVPEEKKQGHLGRRSAQGWESLREEAGQGAEGTTAEHLRARLRPLRVAQGARESTPASALADFARCPCYFYLKHVVGIPEGMLSATGAEGAPAVLLGEVVHEVLRRFPSASDAELLHLVEETCAERSRDAATRDLLPRAQQLVRRWLQSRLAAQVRQARLFRTELPFACAADGGMVEGRIDLLWENADGSLGLLDYKTDHVDEAGAERHGRYLRRQLEVYCLAVTQALGRAPARASLYFLAPDAEVALPTPARKEEVRHGLLNLLQQMRTGPYPRQPGEGCPCPYEALCREQPYSGRPDSLASGRSNSSR